MASSEQVVWTGQCVRCLMCNQQIEVLDGDIKRAVSLHIENHEQLTTRRENDYDTHDTSPSSKAPKSNFGSMVWKENVEINNNKDTSPLKHHSMKHNQMPSDRSEEKRFNFGGKTLFTPKNKGFTIKHSQGVKMVNVEPSISGKEKSNTSVKKSDEKQYLPLSPTRELSMLDGMHNACLKNHLGFIQKDLDGMMACKVCKVDIKNAPSVSEHIKTKSHEYNILTSIKNLISKDRLFEFDFISFCESYLYCNLCKCNIYLYSKNLHVTVVNILNHNSMKCHVQNKSGFVNNSSDLNLTLLSLSQINPAFVDKHRRHVAVEMQPRIICKLCNKLIPCDKNLKNLFRNFKAHFTSEGHNKCVESSSILKIYEELNIPGKKNHKLSLKGDNIHCFICNYDLESDLEKLQEHVQVIISKQPGEKPNNEVPIYKQFGEALAMYGMRTQNPAVVDKEELNVQRLMETMPAQFRNVDYIVKKEPGKLSCMLCNCAMPPTQDHLKAHLLGGRHKMNEEAKKQSEKKIIETPSVASSDVGGGSEVSMMTHGKSFNNLLKSDAAMVGYELGGSEDGTHHFISKLCAQVRPEVQTNTFKTDLSNCIMNIHKKIQKPVVSSQEDKEHDLSDFEVHQKSSTTQSKVVPRKEALIFPMKNEKHFTKATQQGESTDDFVHKHCSELDHNSADVLIDSSSNEKRVMSELIGSNDIIKSNYKYISISEKAEEGYHCLLCLTTIHQCYDSNVLLENFLKHFTGQRHKDLLNLLQADVILELSCSNPIIGAEMAFLKVQDKTIICTLCDISLTTSFEKSSVERLLVSHISGRKHRRVKRKQEHVETSDDPFSTNLANYVNLPHYYNNPLSNSSTQPSDNLRFSTHPSTSLPFIKPLKVRPHLFNQPKSNDPADRLVAESLKTLPGSLQQERRFIKKGWIDGFLSCSLCKCIVDPNLLKDHVLEDIHQKRKFHLKKNEPPCTNALGCGAEEYQDTLNYIQ